MEKIREQIKEFKPNLSSSSLDLYLSKLKKFNNDKGKFNIRSLYNHDKVMEVVDKRENSSTRKSTLTAVVVALQAQKKPNKKLIEKYREVMINYLTKENSDAMKQEKSAKQEKNWVSMDDFVNLINKLQNNIKEKGIIKKDILNNKEYKELQDYVILRLYHEYPFRNDFGSLHIVKNEDGLEKDKNYLVVGKDYKIILNMYKTSKKYGTKEYMLSKQLKSLVKTLLKHNKTGMLLANKKRTKPMSRNNLTITLQTIFMKHLGKKIGSSMLRHIQSTADNEGKKSLLEQQKEEKATEDKYLHSGHTNQVYAKKD